MSLKLINKKSLLHEFFKGKLMVCFFLILLSIFESCLTIIISLSIGNYYEMLSDHNSNKSRLLNILHISIPRDPQAFFIVFGCMVISKFFLELMKKYFLESFALSFSLQLQKKLFRHHLRMNLQDFEKKPVGKYLLRYSGDINSIRHYLTKGVFHFTTDCIFLIISLILLLSLDKTITMVILTGITLGFLLLYLINNKLKQIQVERRNTLSANLHFVNEGLKAITTIKVFNKESAIISRYKNRTENLIKVSKKYIFLESINSSLPHALLFLTLLLIFIVHLYQSTTGINPLESGGKYIPYILLIILMFPTYHNFLEVNAVWQSGNIAFSKIAAVFNYPLEESEENKKQYQPTEGVIEFKDVSFTYPDSQQIINKLNFICLPGHINQLEGNYKSTILKLILGIYLPDSGTILLDGVNSKLFTKQSIRKHITWISDEVPLYGNTIRKCLLLKSINDTENRQKATELLTELNFSNILGKGTINLDDKIGENGKYLSKSQYKKVLIVRALLTTKKIILIDEVLESITDNSQSDINLLLNKLKNTTTIISTVKIPAEFKRSLVIMT